MEYWLYIGDRLQDEHTTYFYSVYDSTQVPTYDAPNELSQHFSKKLGAVRNIRGTRETKLLCEVDACKTMRNRWWGGAG